MSNRKRLIVAITGVILAFFLCYKLAISKTFDLYKEYKLLKKETILSEEVPQRLQILVQTEKLLDSTFAQMNLSDTSVENNLLKTISSSSSELSCQMIDFKTTHRIAENDLTIETYRFVLEGPYVDILKVLHELELNGAFGKTVHVDFVKERKTYKKKENLRAHVFMQQLL